MKTFGSAAILTSILLLLLLVPSSAQAQDRERGRTARDNDKVYRDEDARDRSRGRTDRADRRDDRRADYPDDDKERERRDRDRRSDRDGGILGDIFGSSRSGDYRGARHANVPPGHYPPPGECRLWYPNRPPGHQPPPEPCGALRYRDLGGAYILYGDEAYPSDRGRDYDRRQDYERRRDRDYDRRRSDEDAGGVPEIIIDILESANRER